VELELTFWLIKKVPIPLTSQTDSCLLQAMSCSHTYHNVAYEFWLWDFYSFLKWTIIYI
jgi:hypothetical protein